MNTGEILIYQTPEGKVKLSVTYKDDNFWLSQKLIAQLFDCSTDNVSLHLKNIFASGKLSPDSVSEDFSETASDGKNYKTKFYNLDAASKSTHVRLPKIDFSQQSRTNFFRFLNHRV